MLKCQWFSSLSGNIEANFFQKGLAHLRLQPSM